MTGQRDSFVIHASWKCDKKLHSLRKCGIVNIMNDSLEDFASPKRLKIRQPLGELQVNNC